MMLTVKLTSLGQDEGATARSVPLVLSECGSLLIALPVTCSAWRSS